MIRKKQENLTQPIVIDLTGPNGNAFVLIGMAKNFARQLRYDSNTTTALINEMMAGDYEDLLQVFDREFGSFVILER